jgi:hypothetical protein
VIRKLRHGLAYALLVPTFLVAALMDGLEIILELLTDLVDFVHGE